MCVSGQNSVNFIYNFVEAHEGAHEDFMLKEGRPLIGKIVTIGPFGDNTVKPNVNVRPANYKSPFDNLKKYQIDIPL